MVKSEKLDIKIKKILLREVYSLKLQLLFRKLCPYHDLSYGKNSAQVELQ
jgi:hypothetical protein